MARPAPHHRWPSTCASLLGAALAWVPCQARADWTNFRGSSDGLADNQVFAILEDHRGAMWFGTAGGASRYDGAQWLTLRDPLPNRTVLAVLQDQSGRLWFGTESGGVSRYDGATWRTFSAFTGELPSNQVNAMLEDHAGILWFGTPSGLVRHDPRTDAWHTYTAGPNGLVHPHAWGLLEDAARNLWVASAKGVTVIDSTRTRWTGYTEDPGALARDSVLALGQDRAGNVWLGTDRGAFRYAGGRWSWFTSAGGLASDTVTAILDDGAGGVWFGGFPGVSHFDGRVWRSFLVTSDGDSLRRIRSMGRDASGNLWVGTEDGGLFRYDRVAWSNAYSKSTVCPPEEGVLPPPNVPSLPVLGSNCVLHMLEDRAGELWFATRLAGVARLDRRGRWSSMRRGPGVALSDSTQIIFEDTRSNLWFGSEGSGVARLDSARSSWSAFGASRELPDNTVFSIVQDRRGDLWFGTASGIARYADGQWTRLLEPATAGRKVGVHGFLEDSEGYLWCRADSGLYRLSPRRDEVSLIGTADGLAADTVETFALTRSGALWCGTKSGLSVLAGGAWTTYRSLAGSLDSVLAIAEARDQSIWVVSGDGAVRFSPDRSSRTVFTVLDLESNPTGAVLEDANATVWIATYWGLARYNGATWRHYREGDGLLSDQVTQLLEDRQGHLWMATLRGLSQQELDRTAPQTLLLTRPESLAWTRNARFVFGAGYGETSDVEFSYTFDGQECGCWTREIEWERTDVPDGVHTLTVTSRDWARNGDPTPAHFGFEVDASPPQALIAAPVFGQPVKGVVEVRGTAADPRLREFRVELRPSGLASWNHPTVRTLAVSTQPVVADLLGDFDSRELSDGTYDLRVAVTDTLGLVGVAQITLVVDNHAPYAEVTAPARVSAISGGDIYTTKSELHLYFPPHAFREDALVTITPVASDSVPEKLPSGAQRVLGGYELAWGAAALEKPARLEYSYAGVDSDTLNGALTLYHSANGASWRRLGGTVDQEAQRVRLAVGEPGRYALFAETSVPIGGRTLSALTFTPRVFSPHGAFADREVGIEFVLGQASAVTVRVYNRAGWLVREVVSGQAMGPGSNLVRWDGRDGKGNVVTDGLYLVTVEALGRRQRKPLAVVR